MSGSNSYLPPLGPSPMAEAMMFNRQWALPSPNNYSTTLQPGSEQQFRQWVQKNNVPFDVNNKGPSDYDMRGFYQAIQQGNPTAVQGAQIDPNDGQMHYPDYWKTPYHQTFSNQSQWAQPNAPHWTPSDQLISNSGQVLFDDRAQAMPFGFSVSQ